MDKEEYQLIQLSRKLISVLRGIITGLASQSQKDRETIRQLTEKISSLQKELDDKNNLPQTQADGEKTSGLMVRSLQEEEASLSRELEKEKVKNKELLHQLEVQKSIHSGKKEVKPGKTEKNGALSVLLSKNLSYYYNDFTRHMDPKHMTMEDANQMYNLLQYIFKILKKSGVKL